MYTQLQISAVAISSSGGKWVKGNNYTWSFYDIAILTVILIVITFMVLTVGFLVVITLVITINFNYPSFVNIGLVLICYKSTINIFVPRTRITMAVSRSFSVIGPSLWNRLPPSARASLIIQSFYVLVTS